MLDRRNVITSLVAAVLAIPMLRPARAQTAAMSVVASFSILGDLARQIGGARVMVTDIVGPNQDAHMYSAKPGEAKKLAGARVVLVNGLGFDAFMNRLVEAAGAKAAVVVLSNGITPLQKPAGKGHGHDHDDDHAHGKKAAHGKKEAPAAMKDDPHVWQSIANVRIMAGNIAKAFSAADPDGKAMYAANLGAYLGKLDALDADIRTQLSAIPEGRRNFATTHDAFRYFARDYGLTPLALQGVSTESEPSAGDIAKIVRQLKDTKAAAVFLENVTDPRKIEQIARESGAKVSGTLHSDALSLADGPVPSYIDLMRHNASQLKAALAP